MEIAWNFVLSGAIRLAVIDDSGLPEIRTLMARYWDRPMDFAGATLEVYLAKREGVSTVSPTCRIEGRKRFRIVPDGWP